jgi:DNA-directed RNA polymerase specialized sigma subunit
MLSLITHHAFSGDKVDKAASPHQHHQIEITAFEFIPKHLSVKVGESSELPDAFLESKQLQPLINQNIDTLSEDFRTVFVLRAIEQFSVRETAHILQINDETVKTRYFRAKRLLRGQLQTYLDAAGMKVYEFGGYHCDMIRQKVLRHTHRASRPA